MTLTTEEKEQIIQMMVDMQDLNADAYKDATEEDLVADNCRVLQADLRLIYRTALQIGLPLEKVDEIIDVSTFDLRTIIEQYGIQLIVISGFAHKDY